ncbi:MAG: non-canonical purine NTP pyrophosphatase [Saprospiraceae bacterium]|nr:non-canonical purine NTP pyrophosphatase [Candidatus Brachybacter algidus]
MAHGVYSARYSGPNANDSSNRRLLLENMVNVKDRSAYFRCCIYLKSKNISRSLLPVDCMEIYLLKKKE